MEPRVSKFKEIFLGLERAYGTFQPKESLREDNKAEGETDTQKSCRGFFVGKSSKGLWPSIGIFPINDEDKCRWGCIDVDEYPIDHVSIAQKIAGKNLPFIVTKSKSGGAHIFLFFKEYVNAGIVHHKIRDLASSMGLGHCEVFPKQEKLLREGNESDWEVGSFLNMPYHNGLDQTDRYAFDDKGNVLNLDGFLAEVEKKSLTTEELKSYHLKKKNQSFTMHLIVSKHTLQRMVRYKKAVETTSYFNMQCLQKRNMESLTKMKCISFITNILRKH